jgi:hypothetical protein
MPIDFPDTPTTNQQYTYNGTVWQWNGSSWVTINMATNDFVRTFNGATGDVTGTSIQRHWFI